MKTLWNDSKLIDDYLMGKLTSEDSLLFESRRILDPVLNLKVSLQKKAHRFVKLYARKKLKAELEQIHEKLFRHPDKEFYIRKILQLFP